MSRAQALISELDYEMATTRRMLERLPEARLAWQPHAKSMTLGRLGTHLAEIPRWGKRILAQDAYDLPPLGAPRAEPATLGSRADILRSFDESVAALRELLAAKSDEELKKPWSLLNRGATLVTLPKGAAVRSMVLNHSIHHRGQLSVYLRLNDVPLPAVYGPTADEGI